MRLEIPLLVALAFIGSAARAAEVEPPSDVRSLAECVALALEQHPSIRLSDAEVAAGRARVGVARSGYLPQLSGSWSSDRRQSTFSSRTGGPSSDVAGGATGQETRFYFHQGAVGLSQTLFDFGETLAAIRAAQARRDSLAADADTTRASVVLEVKQAYFALLAARRLLAVAEETVRSDQQQLELARARNEVGFA